MTTARTTDSHRRSSSSSPPSSSPRAGWGTRQARSPRTTSGTARSRAATSGTGRSGAATSASARSSATGSTSSGAAGESKVFGGWVRRVATGSSSLGGCDPRLQQAQRPPPDHVGADVDRLPRRVHLGGRQPQPVRVHRRLHRGRTRSRPSRSTEGATTSTTRPPSSSGTTASRTESGGVPDREGRPRELLGDSPDPLRLLGAAQRRVERLLGRRAAEVAEPAGP